MKATQALHNLGESIWLDNITRDLFDSGVLDRLAAQFQDDGAKSFVKSWDNLMEVIRSKSAALQTSAAGKR